MSKLLFFVFLQTLSFVVFAEVLVAQTTIQPENISIARDEWGVPHIFAKTDAEVAYGLAWAGAEDDFASVQELLLASQSKLARAKGKDKAPLDVISFLIGIEALLDTAYREDAFSPEFKKVLSGYVQGINAYAKAHPKEVLVKNTFPITEKDLVRGYTLGYSLFTGLTDELTKIFMGSIQKQVPSSENTGSNAFAISKNKTSNGNTFLAINSHQPLEGALAWYEVHLHSEEGLNALGGSLPGFLSIGHGVNENLGWAHTVNHPDFTDIYQLEMHPSEKLLYRFDNQWDTLQVRSQKIKIKLGLIKINKKFTFYWSKYGATLEKDGKFYAVRFPANMHIKAAEQQFYMAKAKNWEEFYTTLKRQQTTCFNIVYADREGNVFYLSNGLIPKRNPAYNWQGVLRGDTSSTLWQYGDYYKLSELPQLLNPEAGYVFNTNNSPFNATHPSENLSSSNYSPTMGFEKYENNRSLRLSYLLANHQGKFSYEDFKKIKYDNAYPDSLAFPYYVGLEKVFQLDAQKYPLLAESIRLLQNWDRTNPKESTEAGLFMVFQQYLGKKMKAQQRLQAYNQVRESEIVDALAEAQNHLKKYFKSIEVPLGNVQVHQRGKVELPMGGNHDVLAAMYSLPYKKGKFKANQGESYILMVQFAKEGVILESINAYGASNRKDSPHYTDQMQQYTQQQLKKMILNKEEVLKNAKRVYAPK